MNSKQHSPLIKNCRFTFKCPMEWEKLGFMPDKPNIRHCPTCDKNVHLIHDEFILALSIASKYCVAIPIELVENILTLEADIINLNSRELQITTHLIGAIAPTSRADKA